jgi:hypothetical protein
MTGDAGRRQRFDALFAAHRVDMASYCGWRTASAPDAEDAVAEVFLVAWRRIDDVPAGDAGAASTGPGAASARRSPRRPRRPTTPSRGDLPLRRATSPTSCTWRREHA